VCQTCALACFAIHIGGSSDLLSSLFLICFLFPPFLFLCLRRSSPRNYKAKGDEPPAEPEVPGTVLAKTGRDKSKGRKFSKLLAGGHLPQWVINMYNAAGQTTGKKRDEQTEIVNKMFVKNGQRNGVDEYALDLKNPEFEDLLTCTIVLRCVCVHSPD
jgi:hypothetical protein